MNVDAYNLISICMLKCIYGSKGWKILYRVRRYIYKHT